MKIDFFTIHYLTVKRLKSMFDSFIFISLATPRFLMHEELAIFSQCYFSTCAIAATRYFEPDNLSLRQILLLIVSKVLGGRWRICKVAFSSYPSKSGSRAEERKVSGAAGIGLRDSLKYYSGVSSW